MQGKQRMDLVWGAQAIAEEINVSVRRAFDLMEKGKIPAKKVGGRWVADRAKLRAFFVEAIDEEIL